MTDVKIDSSIDAPQEERSFGGLHGYSAVKDLQTRLKQLGAPVYGDNDMLWARFKEFEFEKRAAGELAYQ